MHPGEMRFTPHEIRNAAVRTDLARYAVRHANYEHEKPPTASCAQDHGGRIGRFSARADPDQWEPQMNTDERG
jgi:hypothetical protein